MVESSSVNLELNFLILFDIREVVGANAHVDFLIVATATRIKIPAKERDMQ